MTKINDKDLEKALSSGGSEKPVEQQVPEMPKEMEIGFHQGALNTLINERNELVKMIQQVEMVMQAHLKRLEEMGVKVQTGSQEPKK
jgi:DNA polymerase I-like protein with 3'-5' exonuclease and polymerase domains